MGGRSMAVGGGVVGVIVVVLLQLLGGGGGGGGGRHDRHLQPDPDRRRGATAPSTRPTSRSWRRCRPPSTTSRASGPPATASGPTTRTPGSCCSPAAVSTGGCGHAPSSVGPFYCPADAKAYIDLSFFKELQDQYGAPGDFARVYVLAHELGHHVQNLLGTSDEVRRLQQANPGSANELSVRLELQADCYAGVWAELGAGPWADRAWRHRGGPRRRRRRRRRRPRQRQPGVVDPRLLRARASSGSRSASTPATRPPATPSRSR